MAGDRMVVQVAQSKLRHKRRLTPQRNALGEPPAWQTGCCSLTWLRCMASVPMPSPQTQLLPPVSVSATLHFALLLAHLPVSHSC